MSANKKVAIIDYGLSNLYNVHKACSMFDMVAELVTDPEQVADADIAILPGVGAFSKAMEALQKNGMDMAIIDFVSTGKPFVGICLGLQLLFDESEEFGTHKGLGLIPGKVKSFSFPDDRSVKVPHIGWNKVGMSSNSVAERSRTPLAGFDDDFYFYFVHSFYVKPKDSSIELTSTNYAGFEFCSSIIKDNIFACQFHPEKSGRSGVMVYRSVVDGIIG